VLVDFELRLRSNIGAEVSAMQSIEKHSILPTTLSLSLTLVLASAFTIVAAFSAQAETCGQLAAVKGNGVEILRMQSGRGSDQVRYAIRVQESKVAPLECDDVIIAGRDSSAKIILANGKLSLGPESRIEIAGHSEGVGAATAKVSLINLTYGKMRALIQKTIQKDVALPAKGDKKAEPQAAFRVRTFSAVAGVRGTDFYTSYDPNAGLTEQATIEGSVEVQQAGTSQKVLVESGKQVSVETTPAALTAASRLSSGAATLEPPKQTPDINEPVKLIKVVPIQDSVRNEIRVTSAVVRDDKDFGHAKAVEVLGKPETWILEREKVPEKLNNLKNEF
jgi:hypothetical protein